MPITHHYWLAVAMVAGAFALIGATGWTEKAFRLVGTSLQLGGVLTVVWGILKTRADFNQAKVHSLLRRWLRQFPPLRPTKTTASAHSILPVPTAGGYAYSTHGSAPDQTLEGKLAHLEGVVKRLEIAQARTYGAVLDAQKSAQKNLDAATRHFTKQVNSVARKVETTATGGIHVSALGVILLFAGTVFSGTAPELHQILTPANIDSTQTSNE